MSSDVNQHKNHRRRAQSATPQKRVILGIILSGIVLTYNYASDLGTVNQFVPQPVSAPTTKPDATSTQPMHLSVTTGAKQTIDIDTELGQLQVEFFADKAPIAVAELLKLAKSGYFSSDTVLETRPGLGFVIAKIGGAVKTYHVKDEMNTLASQRGSVAISKSSVSIAYLNNIFIGFQSQPELEKNYIIIGQVTKGLKPIEKSPPGVKYKVNGFKINDSIQNQALQTLGVQGN